MSAEEMVYRENILAHYREPQNFGEFEIADICNKGLNPLCGDAVEIFVRLNGDKVVEDVRFKGSGCAISQASASMLTETLKGKSLEEVKNISKEDILGMLGIPIGPVRLKCALLSLRVLEGGIVKFEENGVANES
ncbi:SUF system NifU family Fe-S cluster assembly protein [Candidatus Woesearchaeota archaeon]|nr:SUF system NifU family Fe-S cluster assembly protein [Candidatus Woesearchaeota archaeon]